MRVRLGCNTVVFAGHAPADALQWVAWAGFAGVEFASIPGMAAHVDPGAEAEAVALAERARGQGLQTVSIEAATNLFDAAARDRVYAVFHLARRMGVPVVTTGSAGSATADSFEAFVPLAREVAARAAAAGVVWACKPHVGAAVWSTDTALRLVGAVDSPALRLNYDPTHLQRVGEDPAVAAARLAPHLAHVHLRDYDSPDQSIGSPERQTAGRGIVNLPAVIRALRTSGYTGFVDLEIIGAAGWDPLRQMAIAAASCGYLSRLLREVTA